MTISIPQHDMPFADDAQSVQVAQIDVISEDILKTVRIRAVASAHAEMENLLLWRELSTEFAYGKKERAEEQYSAAMMISPATLRRKMWQIRSYTPDDLYRWTDAGISFEHFERAAEYAQIAKKTPKQLLDECITLGDENGNTMTVNNMISHALGERTPRPAMFSINNLFSRFSSLPQVAKFEPAKRSRFDAWIEAGREFFQ